jgi:hypothetical protein
MTVKAIALLALMGSIFTLAAPLAEEAAAESSVVIEEKTCSAVDADGLCVEEDETTDDQANNNEEVHEDVQEYTHKYNFECTDKHENCATWAAAGDCTGEPAGYVSSYCPWSCNTCDYLIAAKEKYQAGHDICKDDHYQCSEWAGMGECDANPVHEELLFQVVFGMF